MQKVLKVILIGMNSVLLFMYHSNVVGHRHLDGLIYVVYCLMYDFFLVPLIFLASKEKVPIALFVVTLLLQNIFAFITDPAALPLYGMYLNIILILTTLGSLFFKSF